MSRGCLISLREQDFTSVDGHPLLHDSLLVDSEDAAPTKISILHGHSTFQLPVTSEAVTLMTALKSVGGLGFSYFVLFCLLRFQNI